MSSWYEQTRARIDELVARRDRLSDKLELDDLPTVRKRHERMVQNIDDTISNLRRQCAEYLNYPRVREEKDG